MNCLNCKKEIKNKPWLHLSKILLIDKDNKSSYTDKYICGYSCYKRLYESDKLPINLSNHIVNKEDYKDLIRPIPIQKQKEFEYLTYEEINQLSEEEKLKYFNEKNEQIHLNSITYEIYDEMNFEDKKTYYLESLSSDDEVIYDDY